MGCLSLTHLTKEKIDRAKGNNLWNDAMFEEAQTQIDHDA
jgi:hypothetical protein